MNNGFKIFEELDDGTIDDIAGEGYWHLEKITESSYSLVVRVNGERHIFNIDSESEIEVLESKDVDSTTGDNL